MNPLKIACATVFALSVSACSSSTDSPSSLDDVDAPASPSSPSSPDPTTPESPGEPGNPGKPGAVPTAPVTLNTPAYQGELSFSSVKTVDLDSFLAEQGLRSVNASAHLSQDGKSARLDITAENGYNTFAIAEVDTDTGEMAWLATDIKATTRLLFDANNRPVAVAGVACESVNYSPVFDDSLVDITSLVPDDRCIAEYLQVSADGNVILFNTYDPKTGTQYLAPDFILNAYTLDTATLVELSDTRLQRNGVSLPTMAGYKSYLSQDGSHYLRKTWWQGTDSDGGTVRQAGAVLWDTATGTWQTRGLSDDLRGCVITEKVSCEPQYSYVLSHDGKVQYSEAPTDQLYDPSSGSPFTGFSTYVVQTGTHSPTPVVLSGVENVGSMATNDSGSLLLYYALRAGDSTTAGYTLYQPETDSRVSLNRALNACPETDESGNVIDPGSCQYTSVPASITSDAESFTADGSSLIIRSVSRLSETYGQVVAGFILDVDTGSMYSLPENYPSDPDLISADASVFLGTSDYPAYDLLIGKR